MVNSAFDSFKNRGFSLATRPGYEIPGLPRDITMLDDEDLMDLFVQYTAWTDFMAGQQAVAAIEERDMQRLLDQAEAQALLDNWKGGSQDRVAVAKAQITASPKVKELREELDTLHAYRKLMETLTGNVERDAQVVSRELTRRTADSGFKARARRYTP